MASSSGEDVPRGLEFLLATLDQMRLVSAVWQFVEQAIAEREVSTQETISI
jgi:hypothetical protein